MCASSSRISLKNSLRNMTSENQPKMDGSILKSSAGVMAYHNPSDWQTTSCVPVSKAGYYEAATTPGLWCHKWRPIQFVLLVDNFGIKYVDKKHALHLMKTLEVDYKITTDWEGTNWYLPKPMGNTSRWP